MSPHTSPLWRLGVVERLGERKPWGGRGVEEVMGAAEDGSVAQVPEEKVNRKDSAFWLRWEEEEEEEEEEEGEEKEEQEQEEQVVVVVVLGEDAKRDLGEMVMTEVREVRVSVLARLVKPQFCMYNV